MAFTAAQLAFVSLHMGLAWDETVYVSQVSGHAPAAYFDPARARGAPLLVAPVTLLTSSVAALRVYLSIASGAGLTAALWVWRPLRPAWVLALAGVFFGGLWVAQYYGPQAMPDMWSALGSLTAVGCYLRWWPELGSSRLALAGLGASAAFVTLVRPGDAVYLAIPLLAVTAARWWRGWLGAAAIAAGLVAGGAEWVIEAWVRFGGIGARLSALHDRGARSRARPVVVRAAGAGRPGAAGRLAGGAGRRQAGRGAARRGSGRRPAAVRQRGAAGGVRAGAGGAVPVHDRLGWRVYRITSTTILRVNAYMRPR